MIEFKNDLQVYRSGHNGAVLKTCDNRIKTEYLYTESYPSGRKGAVLKTVWGQPHKSSNLLLSAIKARNCKRFGLFPLLVFCVANQNGGKIVVEFPPHKLFKNTFYASLLYGVVEKWWNSL